MKRLLICLRAMNLGFYNYVNFDIYMIKNKLAFKSFLNYMLLCSYIVAYILIILHITF